MSLADDAKLLLIPTGYKTSKIYSVFPTDGDGDFDYTRSGDASRVNPGGLIETLGTNIPRIDHFGGGCPTLLLEPQRTNLQVKSEEFDSGFWVKTRTTITGNNAISPNGELTADKLTGTGTGSSYVYDGITLTNGVTYTISIFVKPIINISSFAINVFGGVGTAYFNLVDKTVYSPTGDFTSAKIEDYGNGWLRCSGTLTWSLATGTKNIGYGLIDYGGDQFYLWGAQVEQGDYFSSYIKTTTGTVTRLKDECLNGGDANLFNITEGTFFVDVTPYDNEGANTTYILLSDGTTLNRIIFIFYGNSNQVRFFLSSNASGSTVNYLSHFQSINFNQKNRLAFTFKKNELKCYANGSLVHTISSALVPINLESLDFSTSAQNSSFFEGKVHDIRVYDRVLTEAEAIEITTL